MARRLPCTLLVKHAARLSIALISSISGLWSTTMQAAFRAYALSRVQPGYHQPLRLRPWSLGVILGQFI
jgi:hypothetical protein